MSRSRFFNLFAAVSTLALVFLTGAPVFAGQTGNMAESQAGNSQTSEQPQDGSIAVTVGLAGKWKLGHDLQLRLSIPAETMGDADTLEAESVDGDGVPVLYTQALSRRASSVDSSSVDSSSAYAVNDVIRIGREQIDLKLRLLDGESVIYEQDVSLASEQAGYPSDQVFIATLGGAMGIDELSGTQSGRGRTSVAVAELNEALEVPVDWRAYAPCDLIVISCDDLELLESFSEKQWAALDDWVRRGGHCVISLGVEGKQLPPELADWIGANAGELVRVNDPGPIESLVSTDVPLQPIPVTLMTTPTASVELTLTDTLGRDTPWWLRYARGHGIVNVVASSLGGEEFENWEDRRSLWQRIVREVIDLQRDQEQMAGSVGDASYLGYNDLVGQLRATLDVFPSIRVLSFSQLAAILIGILILIGPVDYFVSVKWLKRPHVSWYFSGVCLLAACVGLTAVYETIRPDEIRVNSAQIVDFDSSNGRVGGRMWTHVYSGSATLVDAEVKILDSSAGVRVDWQALPGRGLGGIESQLRAESGMPPYRISRQQEGATKIVGAGVSAAGTKSLFSTWSDLWEPDEKSQLAEAGGVNQLTGQIVNPLSVELIEPALFYHNWYYALGSRIPANGVTTVSYDAIPKDITRRLNRRRIVENSDVSTPWNPADRSSLDRLLELMMFYKAGSGMAYTSLRHRYHNVIDQSNLMNSNTAVLIGRVEEPFARAEVSAVGRDVAVQQDMQAVWCRVLIPVKPADK